LIKALLIAALTGLVVVYVVGPVYVLLTVTACP
jgi:hypothetical protein